MSLKFVSLLAEPLHSAYKELCQNLTDSGFPVTFLEVDWREGKRMLEEAEADVGAVCGLLYTHLRALGCNLAPLSVPILDHPRYQGKPVYWTDIVTRADSEFEDITTAHWLFNEPGSFSGFHSVRSFLQPGQELGTATETGSHRESLQRLLDGEGDFTALDSTFLDYRDQQTQGSVNVLQSLGPFPSPLLVGYPGSEELIAHLQTLQKLPEPIQSFQNADDEDYDPIRFAYNKSLAMDKFPVGQFFVTGTQAPKREFTSLEQRERDQTILNNIGKELLSLLEKDPTQILHGYNFHKIHNEEREHHHYLISPDELAKGSLSLVGFLSKMKPTVDLKALFDVDADLLEQLGGYEGFLTYSPTEYEKGLWANLAVFRNPAARNNWAANSTHLKAIKEMGPTSYDNVRLHLGVWPSVEEPMEWVATRYLNYTEDGLWRGVRTPRVKSPSH